MPIRLQQKKEQQHVSMRNTNDMPSVQARSLLMYLRRNHLQRLQQRNYVSVVVQEELRFRGLLPNRACEHFLCEDASNVNVSVLQQSVQEPKMQCARHESSYQPLGSSALATISFSFSNISSSATSSPMHNTKSAGLPSARILSRMCSITLPFPTPSGRTSM